MDKPEDSTGKLAKWYLPLTSSSYPSAIKQSSRTRCHLPCNPMQALLPLAPASNPRIHQYHTPSAQPNRLDVRHTIPPHLKPRSIRILSTTIPPTLTQSSTSINPTQPLSKRAATTSTLLPYNPIPLPPRAFSLPIKPNIICPPNSRPPITHFHATPSCRPPLVPKLKLFPRSNRPTGPTRPAPDQTP